MTLPYISRLDRDGLGAAGIPEPWSYGYADRVRFSEIDGLGHVNHLAYLSWFETMRVHYVRDYGITRLEQGDASVVVKGLDAAYHAPMYMLQDYLVTARTVNFRRTSFTMAYGVWTPLDGTPACVAEGTALMVFLDPSGVKAPLSDAVREALVTRDGAEPL